MATGPMSFESRACRAPGMAHGARNCSAADCVEQGKCQYKVEPQWRPERIELPITPLLGTTTVKTEVAEKSLLPTDKQARKDTPIGTGVLDYFPAALAEVARCSKQGNDQHNPGQPLHWARGKSMDHFDAMVRHGMERGTIDTDGIRHSAKAAWRALAQLQQECEDAGAPLSRASKVAE